MSEHQRLSELVRLWIDDRPIDVPPGTTVLDAARRLGIDLPALCYREGHDPNTACMCCLVRVAGRAGPVPSCAIVAEDTMRVECETEELHQLRRTGLELILSDHIGDCHAPCQTTCPARMDIPDMMQLVAAGQYREAIATIKRDIALPATLGRVCPEVCERACHRNVLDQPVAVCQVKRFVADHDLQSGSPYCPRVEAATGRRVAIVGAGPTGLTAAYHLVCRGHACTLLEACDELGGRLRQEFPPEQLPREVLDAEISVIVELGAKVRTGHRLGRDVTLDELVATFDAVLLCTGALRAEEAEVFGVQQDKGRLAVDPRTGQTSVHRVFAAGNAVRRNQLVVQSVAAGKAAAGAIDRCLRGEPIPAPRRVFQVRRGRLSHDEVDDLRHDASPAQRTSSPPDTTTLTEEQMRREAERCLHCDCAGLESCRLRYYADLYDCDPHRFRGTRRRVGPCLDHREVVFEPGKCIACGICLQIAREVGEPIGLTFAGRGFDVRVAVPLDRSLDDALTRAAAACAEACPTGALVPRRRAHTLHHQPSS